MANHTRVSIAVTSFTRMTETPLRAVLFPERLSLCKEDKLLTESVALSLWGVQHNTFRKDVRMRPHFYLLHLAWRSRYSKAPRRPLR